ncbi:MAG: response regulator transcription factor [Acidobacteriota bacterium]
MLSVLVSTDEPMVEVGLKTLLGSEPGINLLEVCRTHAGLLQSARRYQPDLLVCGLTQETAELNGIRELQLAAPQSRIVMWAREVSTEMAHHAVELGVRGFLSTTASPAHFLECLQISARGELWMESSLTMNLLNNRPVSLSKRQSELVALLTQGLKNKEIATTLGISEGTVKAYLTTLYEKVGARDRFELALFGLKNLGGRREHGSAGGPIRSLVARRGVSRTEAQRRH